MQADAPLVDEADDRLDRRSFAARVVEAIELRSDRASIVFGIYGPWGDGKTTVLNWVRNRLERSGRVEVVAFNPWLVRDEATLVPAFFATLATALGRRIGGRRGQVAGVLRRYGRVLSGVSVGVPGVSVDPGTTAEAIGSALGDRTLEELKAEVERILRDDGRRVLVIFDDIDRLDDDEIHAVFKLVKLAAAFEGITYLLAFDDDRVAAALARRYSAGSVQGGVNEGGYDFLEKIVQVPLRLPKARKDALDQIALSELQGAVDDAGVDVVDGDVREFGIRFSQGLSPAIESVRTIRRYVNAARFALPLLRGEANSVDVLTIEGVNACYPTLYATMREHPSWFLLPYELTLGDRDEEIRSRRRQRLEQVLEQIDPEFRDPARELIKRLFPQTESVWSNVGQASERNEWAEQQRVCSPEYFDRYFSYGLAGVETGDLELADVLESAEGLEDRFRALVERKGTRGLEAILRKLQRRGDGLDPARAAALIRAVTDLGPRVAPHNRPRWFERNLVEWTASLIAELLFQLPAPGQRAEAAAMAVARAEPLLFAAEIVRWTAVKKSQTDDRRPLGTAETNELRAGLSARIAAYVERLDHPLWLDDQGIRLMYWARHGGQASAMRDHARLWLQREPRSVIGLLWSLAGVAYTDGDVKVQQDLTTDKYAGTADVADLDDVRAAVRTIRGEGPGPAEFPSVRWDESPRGPDDSLILEQFIWQDANAEDHSAGTGGHPSTAGSAPVGSVDGDAPPAPLPQAAPAADEERSGPSARVTLHGEIEAVLRDAAEPLAARDIADRIRARDLYRPPRRSTPLDGRQVSARISRPEYRSRFRRTGRLISLREATGKQARPTS
jgi:hypothetical protein